MDERLLKTCSEDLQDNLRDLHETYSNYDREEPLTFRDSVRLFPLSKVGSSAVPEYLKRCESEQFWNWDALTDEPYLAWYTFRLLNEYNIEGWRETEHVSEIINWFENQQTIRGEFRWVEDEDHTSPLALFVEARPDSHRTKKAIEYFLSDPPELYPAYNLPIGISAVCDYDYYRYQDELESLADDLADLQTEEGFFANRGHSASKSGYDAKVTAFAIRALTQVSKHDSVVSKAIGWLSERTGRLSSRYRLIGLMYSHRGPKVPISEHEWADQKAQQKMERVRSQFVETLPPVDSEKHVTSIRSEMTSLIQSTENELKICTPYIDILHEDIIDLTNSSGDIEAYILSKPKGDISGHRQRLAKSAIEQLNRASNREVRTNRLLHARMMISDNESLLISSADLTRDQLVDEFNTGLLTSDESAVSSAVEYFEKVWEASNKL